MKPAAIALPAITLLAAGIWLGSQHHSISALEKQSEVLKKRIAAHDAAPVTVASAPGRPSRDKKPEKAAKEKIDWKGLGEQFTAMQHHGGVSDVRTALRFQQQLQSMTADELLAALDEIATLDLPKESLLMLEQMLLTPLAQKEPGLALNRFMGRLESDSGRIGWALTTTAMKEWCKKDTVAAAAWLDGQIASGKLDSKSLDGKSSSRSMLEGPLIGALLSTDPDAAFDRLETLPEAQRAEAMRMVASQMKEEQQATFAKMVREQLPEDERTRELAQAASRMAMTRDYSNVSAYIERISATPEERTAIVTEIVGDKLRMLSFSNNEKITQVQVDKVRDWALSNSPNDANTVTGKALAQVSQNGNKNSKFEDVAELAVRYHESTGNDELMIAFLQNTNIHANKEKSREMAEKISDPQRREEVLKRFK